MNEQITSPDTNLEFHQYFNRILYDFEKNVGISNEPERGWDYMPEGCNLLFLVENISCNYALVFENNQFFFKLNFKIDDNQHLDLRNRFYEKLNFLISDNRFYSQDENSIVLKSQIDEKLIERTHIIFATERWMNSYFFPETKIAMWKIVSMVFVEFEETMHQVWKTIIENFEIPDFSNLVESSEDNSSFPNLEEENRYNLPEIIKIYFDSYNKQKLEQTSTDQIILKKIACGKTIYWQNNLYIYGEIKN